MAANAEKSVVVLGSTGSVGTQALEVLRGLSDRFRVAGLSAHSRWQLLARQVREFEPEVVALTDPLRLDDLREALVGCPAEVIGGPEALPELAARGEADVVISAVSGVAGVPAAVAALESGRTLALANKESLVSCGPLLTELASRNEATILPVDSEHSAVFQLLRDLAPEAVKRIILTASGGPFRELKADELAKVTPGQALHHPTWKMGRKITVDSATLMNKALEVVEARWLFGVEAERLEVLVHPQSVVHSIVELVDGSSLAHMGAPDMRIPIQYALSYPERLDGNARRLDLAEVGRLEFAPPDRERFPALDLGFQVARLGGTSGAVLNAADEVAVDAFLDGDIGFTDIFRVVETTLGRHTVRELSSVDDVMAAHRWARREAEACLHSA